MIIRQYFILIIINCSYYYVTIYITCYYFKIYLIYIINFLFYVNLTDMSVRSNSSQRNVSSSVGSKAAR